jgi:hypothetical protein
MALIQEPKVSRKEARDMSRLLRRALRPISAAGVGVLIAVVACWAVAFAQYPPPVGAVTAGVSNPVPSTGASVTATCLVVDSQGQPVADEPCTFTIISQPGTDATLGAPSVTVNTNAQGIATAVLSVGTESGAVVLGMSAMGVQSQVTVNTQAPGIAPPTLPAGAQPGAAPPTGAGDSGEGQVPVAVWAIAIGAAVGLALASLFLWRAAARRPKGS